MGFVLIVLLSFILFRFLLGFCWHRGFRQRTQLDPVRQLLRSVKLVIGHWLLKTKFEVKIGYWNYFLLNV